MNKKTKVCTKCGETKCVSKFSKNKTNKDGLSYSCRKCRKAWREANKEKIAKQSKAYYKANKEKLADTYKAYYEANKRKL